MWQDMLICRWCDCNNLEQPQGIDSRYSAVLMWFIEQEIAYGLSASFS